MYHTANWINHQRDKSSSITSLKEPYPEYDFIIIGAGSAGCALASRLTRNRNVTVLLLESGKPEMLLTDIPAIAPATSVQHITLSQTPLDTCGVVLQAWERHREPPCLFSPNFGMNNHRCFWPRGKAIGGTSVINYMIYTRGIPRDWDRIAEDGNYGWYVLYTEAYPGANSACLQYFTRSRRWFPEYEDCNLLTARKAREPRRITSCPGVGRIRSLETKIVRA